MDRDGLKKTIRKLMFPLSWRKLDDQAFNALAENDNTLTSDKILRLEFNQAALDDMGITEAAMPHHDVHVRGFFQDKLTGLLSKLLMSAMALGYTHIQKPGDYKNAQDFPAAEADKDYRSVYLNRALFSPPGQYFAAKLTSSVAASFAATAAHGIAAAAAWVINRPLLLMGLLTPVRKVIPLHIISMPFRSMAKIMGHEHIHFLQKVDRDTKTSGFDVFRNAFQKANAPPPGTFGNTVKGINSLLSFGMTNYFTHDFEVQARLHTVMAQGSHRWEHLPKTKAELWEALADAGLHMPDEIKKELKRLKGEFNQASGFAATTPGGHLSRLARAAFSPDVADLRAAQASFLHSEGKADFWRKELPYLYGHLLEMYGQKDGRKMMGFAAGELPVPLPPELEL